MGAILKRELKSSLLNITGWIYIAVMMAAFSLYYYANNLMYGSPMIAYSVSGMLFITMIPVSMLTMKSLAEEKRSKTDQLIFTAPVSIGKIVVAKFLSMAIIHTVVVVYMLIMSCVLQLFGNAPMLENLSVLLGYLLYGYTCMAIGLFISSLTESQVISAVLTFAALFMGYMMSGITNLISSEGNLVTKILNCYNIKTPMDSFMDGCLYVKGIIYYVVLIALMLFLTAQSIQKRRWTFSTKRLTTGAFSTGLVAIAIVASIIINLAANELPSTIASIDLTEQKFFTLTDDTKELVAGLDKNIEIYVIANESTADVTVAETLKRYEDSSSYIKVTYVDPAKNPTFYTKYTDSSISQGSIIVVCGDVSRVVDYSDLYETSIDYTTYSQNTTGYDAEGQITSAIQYVSSDDLPVAYEITGHGEEKLSGNFKEAISKANITAESLNLLEVEAIPSDASVVIINGPTSDFSADDAQKITDYLMGGGKLFVTVNYAANEELPNLATVFDQFGITVENGIVAEQNRDSYYQNPFYLLPKYTAGSTYGNLESGSYLFVPYSLTMEKPEDTDQIVYTDLISTSSSAVAKMDPNNATTYEAEEGDKVGQYSLGLLAEKNIDLAQSSMAIFTSELMFTDDADSMVSGNNSSMFAGIISYLASSDNTASVVIPVKEYSTESITVPTSTLIIFSVGFIVVVPLALIILGIIIWARRRKK